MIWMLKDVKRSICTQHTLHVIPKTITRTRTLKGGGFGLTTHVLAQRTMRNTHLCEVLVIGWAGWAHGTSLFPPAHPFIFQKNEPGPVYETLHLVVGGGNSYQLQIARSRSLPFDDLTRESNLVREDPKLLDNDGEIPKSQGKGWWFDSRLWNLLSTWQKTYQVVNYLMCFGVGLSAFYLQKKKKKKKVTKKE